MRASVSGRICTHAQSAATRSVSALCDTSTMRARPSLSTWLRSGRRRRDIAGSHQRLADQETARADRGEPVEIGGLVEAALADDDAPGRRQRREAFGGMQIDL